MDKQKKSLFRKIIRWMSIMIFMAVLPATLIFYNLYTVVSEKNIKKIGEKVVSDLLYQNKAIIDENYTTIIAFAKAYPEENIEFPTGLTGLNINIKASEFSSLSQEEFYEKIPIVVADNIYRETLDVFINDFIRNNSAIPSMLKEMFFRFNSDNTVLFRNLFFVSAAITLLALSIYLFLTKKTRALVTLGLVSLLVSLPPFLLLYFAIPAINDTIRKSDFEAVASMLISMLDKIQANYLYFSIFGLLIFITGFLSYLGFSKKSFKIKRKKEFEKIIRS